MAAADGSVPRLLCVEMPGRIVNPQYVDLDSLIFRQSRHETLFFSFSFFFFQSRSLWVGRLAFSSSFSLGLVMLLNISLHVTFCCIPIFCPAVCFDFWLRVCSGRVVSF